MLWGLFEKIVISDRVAIVVNQVYENYTQYAGFQIIVASALFAVQIYCDFSGYSDIAIGAARIMGIELMENFCRPYFSKSVSEFWRRWHISLSTWFRDYVYIPLGGNRCTKLKRYRNIMIVFLTSGLWHGSSWNYVIWGGLHGLYQIMGDCTKPFRQKFKEILHVNTGCFSYRLLQVLVTFCMVDFAWIFFRAPGTKTALKIIQGMFSVFNPWIFFDGSLYSLGLEQKEFWLMILFIAILLLVDFLRQNGGIYTRLSKQNTFFRWLVYYAIIVAVLLFGIYGPAYVATPFLYFQF